MPSLVGNDINYFLMTEDEYRELSHINGDYDFDDMMSLEPDRSYAITCTNDEIITNQV